MSEEEADVPGDDHTSPENKLSLLAKLRIGALIAAAIAVIVVVARNWEPIAIDLMGKKIDVPLSVLVILTFFFGILIGVLLAYIRPWRNKAH